VARNHTPVARAQSIVLPEDTTALITLSGADVERHRLTFVVVSEPRHGALSGRLPNLTYTPTPQYNGVDSFTFVVRDASAESDPAAVSITVTPVNDPPTAVDDTLVTGRNVKGFVGAGAVDVLGNDSIAPDVGETLTVVNTQQGANGATGFTSSTVYYLPNSGFVGTDRFTYTVCDDGTTNGIADVKCTLSAVSVTVKESIAADLSISVAQSTALVAADSDVAFVVTLRNSGPDDANLITYGLDIGDANASLVSVSGAAGRCSTDARGFECVLGALASGDTVTARAVVHMSGGQSRISARASSATDSTPSNNIDTASVEVR
jgi:hypothetical protein